MNKTTNYDAILILSFGGPEGMDEVIPFLENVLRGKNVPRERMIEVSHHYEQFDGISPINDQNRALIAALQKELDKHGPHLPIYWGNRNWHPMLADTMQQMADDGIKQAITFVTSAYSSYSGCRQYREDIIRAQTEVGANAPQFDKLRVFYNHPDFISLQVKLLTTSIHQLDCNTEPIHIAFTAHSIPHTMSAHSDYEQQLRETSRLIASALNQPDWSLVYQSRSGPPHQPWLEPDILDHLTTQQKIGTKNLIIAPIGFLSDHMEVLFDLDHEAIELAKQLELNVVRAPTVGINSEFITLIRKLLWERVDPDNHLPEAIGQYPANHHQCPIDCCHYIPTRAPRS